MDFEELKGKTLLAISKGTYRNQEAIIFDTADQTFVMYHYRDCCESVYIEEVIGDPQTLIGYPILKAEELSNIDESDELGYVTQYTFYHLHTNGSTLTLRWYGRSNGYYSTSVCFEPVMNYYKDTVERVAPLQEK